MPSHNVSLTIHQVRRARRLAADGRPVRQIATEMGVAYDVLWMAVRGRTWKHLTDPPPVGRVLIAAVCTSCGNPTSRNRRLCDTCRYWRKQYGLPRRPPEAPPYRKRVLGDEAEIRRLYEEYKRTESIRVVAEMSGYRLALLHKRFRELGLDTRLGVRPKLTEGQVVVARQMVARGEKSTRQLAREWGVPIAALYAAVSGETWRHVGGLAENPEREKRPCARCEILTDEKDGVCPYCRAEKHGELRHE
jgi:RNA polymerase subunit RPABC4/transcription elongation factor Spt4